MKKVLLFIALLSIMACFFVIGVSAETPSMYVEFKVMLTGQSEYITAYVQNKDSGNPYIDLAGDFYSDVEFTQLISKDDIVKLDMSEAVTVNSSTEVVKVVKSTNLDIKYVNCNEVKWVSAPGSATTVGTCLFDKWTSLKKFDFGTATVLVDACFRGCALEELVFPDTVVEIKGGAFSSNKSLKSVKFEGDIPKLASSIFSYCSALESIDFGPMTKIGTGMFQNCTALKSITIPSTVTEIGKQAFQNCTAINSVDFAENSQLTKIGNDAFYKIGGASIVLPDLVTEIGSSAFKESLVTSITFNDGLKTIGSSAFLKTPITSVVIPASITSLGNEAFANCKSLTSVVFEEGFAGTLGSSAFMGTSELTNLTLVEGITKIPYQCFWSAGTTNGIEKVTLPDSVESLAGRAFNSSGIKVLEIRETSQLKSITGDALTGMKSLTSIYLPTGVVISCDNLFQYCHKLERVDNFENVIFNVSSYGENVFPTKTFYECMALKEIKIPHSVTAIAGTAWRYFALERIYIPSSVTSISKDWLDNKDHMPSTVTFLYCGGDAQKLLSLTADQEGNVSTRLTGIIENGKVVNYTGLNTAYDSGVIVTYANTCDVYYGGVHLETDNKLYTFVDAEGNVGKEYLSSLKISNPCGRACGEETVLETIAPIFESLGISTPEFGGMGSITMGYKVNYGAMESYTRATEDTISFGVFATSSGKLGTNDIMDENGNVTQGVIAQDLSKYKHSLFELKISGFETDEQKNAKLCFGVYVIATDEDGKKISFLQEGDPAEGQKYYFASYNDLVTTSPKE